MLKKLKRRAHQLKSETFALYLAARDPRTPWYAKLLVAGVAAYAFSPIDLIPDFIPVIGYLDDIIIVPLGISLAIRMVPDAVMADCRARAEEATRDGKPVSRAAGVVVILIWLLLATLGAVWMYEAFASKP